MTLNLYSIAADLNREFPSDHFEAVPDYLDGTIKMRRKLRFPMTVVTREAIEDNLDYKRAYKAALAFAEGITPSYDPLDYGCVRR